MFFGGGTPTLLPAEELGRILGTARDLYGFRADAEITAEANPDTVTLDSARTLAEAGFTRISLGMQSAVPRVLRTLDRTHDPRNVPAAVDAARSAGLEVSVDLIYGTPGESLEDWRASLEAAISMSPDHVSAYSLIVEEGTAMAAAVKRGQLPDIDGDDHADKYMLADELLRAAGYDWYEVSNWARSPETRSEHNLNYWLDSDWWGLDRVRIPTWPGCAGGTSSTPPPTPSGSMEAPRLVTAAKRSTRNPWHWSTSCCACA